MRNGNQSRPADTLGQVETASSSQQQLDTAGGGAGSTFCFASASAVSRSCHQPWHLDETGCTVIPRTNSRQVTTAGICHGMSFSPLNLWYEARSHSYTACMLAKRFTPQVHAIRIPYGLDVPKLSNHLVGRLLRHTASHIPTVMIGEGVASKSQLAVC